MFASLVYPYPGSNLARGSRAWAGQMVMVSMELDEREI